MRIDAKNLLDRLGRSEFQYKEFADRFTELELWPILEVLLTDARLQTFNEPMGPAQPALAPGSDAPEGDAIRSLFRRFESGSSKPETPEVQRRDQDVRAMLRHLSELGTKGEI